MPEEVDRLFVRRRPAFFLIGCGVVIGVGTFSPAAAAQSVTTRPIETSQGSTVGKLASLITQSGYESVRIDDSTWRIAKTGRVLPEIAIFVGESVGAVGFVVKLAGRSEISGSQDVLNALLAQNSELGRAKLYLANSGDLLLSSSGSLRVMDLADFRSHVEEIVLSADVATEKLQSVMKTDVPPAPTLSGGPALNRGVAESLPSVPANVGAPVEFESSNALGPRRRGRGGPGTLIARAGAVAFNDASGAGGGNGFSAACSEIVGVRVDEKAYMTDKKLRLRIDLKGQAYELNGPNARAALDLVVGACSRAR